MDKVEYRELIRNIKNKYLQKDYEGVIEAADQLDPEKIRENSILEIIAKAYEAVGRSDLARETLLVAYKRTPSGKRIAYNLTMLSIKLEDLDSAVMFYEDFCKMAPKDSQRLLLKYEIGKAGGVPVSDLAKVLENYNAREMDDKWEYELARLYHEMGDDEKCAAACDQIILWYADGEYEKKALELKNMHKALTPSQQARYEEIMANILYNTPGTEEYEINKVLEIQPMDQASPKQEKEQDTDSAQEESAENEKKEQELPQIDYETSHLEPQMFTEETEPEDEENIAGQLSLSAMLDAFRNQTVEDREQMNRMGEDRAAQILAEINDTHDSSHLDEFEKDVNENEPVSEVIEPEVPLLSREDVIEPVDDGGEDLGERAAEFAFEKEGEVQEPETPKTIESSVDATQFIPVEQIAAKLPAESAQEDDPEKVAPSVVRETSVFEEIDPGSAAGKVAVGSSSLDMEELIRDAGLEEKENEAQPKQQEAAAEEPSPETVEKEDPETQEPGSVPEKEEELQPEEEKAPEKEFQLDLIFGNSVIPQRTRRVRTPEPVKEETVAEKPAEEVVKIEEEAVEAIEETTEEAEEIAEEASEEIEEITEETAEEAEEIAEETVEEAEEIAEEAVEGIEEITEEAAEEAEVIAKEAAEEPTVLFEEIPGEAVQESGSEEQFEEDLYITRTRAQEDAVLNAGAFSFGKTLKKTESARNERSKEEKEKVKAEKQSKKLEKAKLREEKLREKRLRAEEQRVEKFREKKLREEKLQEEKRQREEEHQKKLQEEKALQEEQAAQAVEEEAAKAVESEEPAAEPVPDTAMKESAAEPEKIEDAVAAEEPEDEEEEAFVPKARGFFRSLFGRKGQSEIAAEDELTEEEIAAEEPAEEEPEEVQEAAAEAEKIPEEEPVLEEKEEQEEQEVAAQAAAAETIEKLREFVAREEENASEEPAEEPAAAPAGKPMPALRKPENNPEADAAAAAALERFRKLSAREEEEDWFAGIEIRDTQEEPVRPMRGNKVYKGNKDPKKAKARTVPDLFDETRKNQPPYQGAETKAARKKKAKNRKESERFGEELFAQTQESHMERETIDIDELLNEALQKDTSKKKEEITEEALNMLLDSSIDLHRSEEKTEETRKKPEKELTVSETGEYDLDGFIRQDNHKEITRQMSFDDLFGGEFRPKVRIPAEAVKKTPETQLVFSKKYSLSEEQRKALGEFLMIDGMEAQICAAIDNLITKKKSGDDTGGHLIVTGDAKSGKTYLTIEILKAVNQEVGHGNPRIAKVQAQAINGKNIRKVLAKVTDSDLIIENIGKLEDATIRDIITAVRENNASTMVILEGNQLAADTMIQRFPDVARVFKTRIDIGELTLTQWADIAQKYARSQGYSIEGPALLALHARLSRINTSDIRLGNKQVKEIVDEAIEKTQNRSSGKLFSAFSKKNEDTLVPLTEDNFM